MKIEVKPSARPPRGIVQRGAPKKDQPLGASAVVYRTPRGTTQRYKGLIVLQ